ncbi:MAG: putative zinc-binding metallopeptidase [Odoribacteraceae bacterium]|jgi:hypothetical protein|nr:putative zinc-binding metallopeptidase [Odoribacteraceae bacterium]
MKNKINIITTLALAAAALFACSKEETIDHYTGPENVYGDHTLPQGNHDYDADIVAFYGKYNTLILYKYVPHDIYWNVTSNVVRPVTYDTLGNIAINGGHLDTPVDEAYVGEQLRLIREKFLSHYPEDFLVRMLPKKILLVRSFVSLATTGVATNVAPFSGYDYLLFPYGGPEITTLTPAQVNDFKARASDVFIRRLVNNGKIERDPLFLSISNYSSTGTTAERPAKGFITPSATTPATDWEAYVNAIVTTPYATFVAPRGSLPVTSLDRTGMFDPAYDTGGLIRKKYDAMIAYFEDVHGIDLQAIGDDFIE